MAVKSDAKRDSRRNQYARYFWSYVLVLKNCQTALAKFSNWFIGQHKTNQTIDVQSKWCWVKDGSKPVK
jgi:hypothetical protein